MKLLYEPELTSKYSDKILFLDADVIIDSKKYIDLLKFLFEFKSKHIKLKTIQSVFFEFMRGSQSLLSFNDNVKFFNKLVNIYSIEKNKSKLDDLEDLIVVMSNIQKNDSYADFLLTACLYVFKEKALLMTGNNKHYPLKILDRVNVVTLDTGSEIKNYGVYKFSEDKYQKAAKNILKNR